jgi:uncharacterized RDD family membrane protein YckC
VFGGPKVIPIPTFTPVRSMEREEKPRPPRRPPSRAKRVADSQQSFELTGNANALGTKVEAVVCCDAPVALPVHRMIAAAFDISMILAASGLFLAIFFIAGGVMAFSRHNMPFFAAVVVLLALFYRFLFCIADGDTPGHRFAGLRVVDFDGRKPDREQRGLRQLASLLSLVSVGLGLVWALVDEESLTWHDHISKTFPTVG